MWFRFCSIPLELSWEKSTKSITLPSNSGQETSCSFSHPFRHLQQLISQYRISQSVVCERCGQKSLILLQIFSKLATQFAEFRNDAC